MKPWKFKPLEELGIEIPRGARREALEAAAEYIRTAMLDYIGSGTSPVSGGKWVRSLTKEYAAKKGEESSAGFANLELSGDLLDSLTVEAISGTTITVDVGSDERDKAEGHLTGLYGKNSRIRPRQFMPQDNQRLKKDILQGVKDILKEYESDGES